LRLNWLVRCRYQHLRVSNMLSSRPTVEIDLSNLARLLSPQGLREPATLIVSFCFVGRNWQRTGEGRLGLRLRDAAL
jgi:hypothetical protein